MKKKSMMLLFSSVATMLFFASTASATFLNDWYLDIDAGGSQGATQVNEYLDIVGPAYIQNTFNSATTFDFSEVAVFNSIQHDGGTLFPFVISGYELTGYFEGTGSGSLGADLTFTTGTLDIYSDSSQTFATAAGFYGADDGTKIATFSLTSGTGTVDATGVPNGQITVVLESTFMAAGYFFDENMIDLSLTDPIEWILGYSTTNASYVSNPSSLVVSEFGVGANTPPLDLVVSSNGQYRLSVVPEPSTFLLLGAGLLGLGFTVRRRK